MYPSLIWSLKHKVNTAVPALQNMPARKALNGKLPTMREYTNCINAVASALRMNISRTCRDTIMLLRTQTIYDRHIFTPCSIPVPWYVLVHLHIFYWMYPRSLEVGIQPTLCPGKYLLMTLGLIASPCFHPVIVSSRHDWSNKIYCKILKKQLVTSCEHDEDIFVWFSMRRFMAMPYMASP